MGKLADEQKKSTYTYNGNNGAYLRKPHDIFRKHFAFVFICQRSECVQLYKSRSEYGDDEDEEGIIHDVSCEW